MTKKIGKFVYWTPRILGILFVLFLMIFSFDVFEMGLNPIQTAIAFFIHNIPAMILAIMLAVSWKHEIVGAVGFIFAGLLYIITLFSNPNFEWYMLSWSLIIAGPAFLIGILFLKNWQIKKR